MKTIYNENINKNGFTKFGIILVILGMLGVLTIITIFTFQCHWLLGSLVASFFTILIGVFFINIIGDIF